MTSLAPPRRSASRGPLLRGSAVCLIAVFVHLVSQASGGWPQPVQGGYLSHAVNEGETLPQIARQYLSEPSRWQALLAVNGLRAGEPLAAGTVLRIPARWLRASAVQARVEDARGHAVLRPVAPEEAPDGGEPSPAVAPGVLAPAARLAAGARLGEGARVDVPADGYLRLRLADGSVLHVLAGSDVALKRMRRRNHGSDFEAVVDVRRGTVEADVARQPRGRVFEIHAPGTVASVRGTRFGVSVDAQGRVGTRVAEGEVALRTRVAGEGGGAAQRQLRLTAGEAALFDGNHRLEVFPQGAPRPAGDE